MGDTVTKARGKASQAAGAAQNLYGQVVSFASILQSTVGRTAIDDGFSLGVMVGFLLGRR